MSYVLGERAAEAVRRLMRGDGGVTTKHAPASSSVDFREYAHPWEIQWAQSENDGDGSWIIWLPAVGSLKENATISTLDGAFSSMRSNLDAADNHSGWLKLDLSATIDGTVYLKITPPPPSQPSYPPTMSIVTSTATGSVCVPIATIKRSSTGVVTVKQLLVGELVVGGSGGSPSPEPTETTPRLFDIEESTDATTGDKVYKVVRCTIYCGNKECTCSDYTIPGSGYVYLHVERPTSGSIYNISLDMTSRDETSTHVCFKIWEVGTGGKPVCDRRIGIAPVFAL